MTDRDYRDGAARLVILQHLAGCPVYTSPETEVRAALAAEGLVLSGDAVRGHLAWLDEAGLILVGGGKLLRVPTLTARGQDVATGAAAYPGVARPPPV
jgi:hypothetical protein